MPTAFTHAFVAIAMGKAVYRRPMPWKFWTLTAVCAAFPDLDTGLFAYGVQYEDLWGHRGMMHSLLFALALAMVIVTVFFRTEAAILGREWWKYVAFFFAATASHGVLDAFTDGGLGIAFFSPFDETRYFFPWHPIEVAPIGLTSFFTRHGWISVRSELVWVWLPTIMMLAVVIACRRRRVPRSLSPSS